jgi:hypothetical protein
VEDNENQHRKWRAHTNRCKQKHALRVLIAGMMAPEKSWCLVESPARWEPQEEGVMNTAARFSLN